MKSLGSAALLLTLAVITPAHSAELGEVVDGIKIPEFTVDLYANPDKWRNDAIESTTKQIVENFGADASVGEATKLLMAAAFKEIDDAVIYFTNARKMGALAIAKTRLDAAANKGDVRAMHIKGAVALTAADGKKNVNAARLWLQKAADLNHAPSQFMLGGLYGGLYDSSVGGDLEGLAKMRGLMRRAADQGHAGARAAIIVDEAFR